MRDHARLATAKVLAEPDMDRGDTQPPTTGPLFMTTTSYRPATSPKGASTPSDQMDGMRLRRAQDRAVSRPPLRVPTTATGE